MAHPRARLNAFGRRLLVTRVLAEGWPVATASEAMGVSRATGHKWVRRYRAEGLAGLLDRSSRPHRSPRATPAPEVERILAARSTWRWGPDRLGPLMGHPPSTVAAVLRRTRAPRLADLDRPSGLPVRRYEECHPGALVHQDHKKLGRIPDGGGHRAHGRSTETRRRRAALGCDHFEVVVDDRSRRSVVVRVTDESAASAAAALEIAVLAFEGDGVAVERVMTDNGSAYRSALHALCCRMLGLRHLRTRPYRPQTNGKAERFIRTMLAEWAYGAIYRSSSERTAALDGWLWRYNFKRNHGSLGRKPPAARLAELNNPLGSYS